VHNPFAGLPAAEDVSQSVVRTAHAEDDAMNQTTKMAPPRGFLGR